jgi:hypothetical protein
MKSVRNWCVMALPPLVFLQRSSRSMRPKISPFCSKDQHGLNLPRRAKGTRCATYERWVACYQAAEDDFDIRPAWGTSRRVRQHCAKQS